jgi:hypothetical protein
MRALPLEHFLVELGPDSGPPPPTRALKANEPHVSRAVAEDCDTRLAQAYERGKAQGAAEAAETLAARLRQAEAAAEGRIAAARAEWLAHESGRLAERLEAGLREVELAVADATARILKPFLLDRVRAEAVESLAATIADVVRYRDGARVEIAGPADLAARVAERIAALGVEADVREAEGPDVRVSIGLTALETSLATWLARIEGAVR